MSVPLLDSVRSVYLFSFLLVSNFLVANSQFTFAPTTDFFEDAKRAQKVVLAVGVTLFICVCCCAILSATLRGAAPRHGGVGAGASPLVAGGVLGAGAMYMYQQQQLQQQNMNNQFPSSGFQHPGMLNQYAAGVQQPGMMTPNMGGFPQPGMMPPNMGGFQQPGVYSSNTAGYPPVYLSQSSSAAPVETYTGSSADIPQAAVVLPTNDLKTI